jgi:hypothetical protein
MVKQYRYCINHRKSGSGYVVGIEASQPAKCGEWLVVDSFYTGADMDGAVKLAEAEIDWLQYSDLFEKYNFSGN